MISTALTTTERAVLVSYTREVKSWSVRRRQRAVKALRGWIGTHIANPMPVVALTDGNVHELSGSR